MTAAVRPAHPVRPTSPAGPPAVWQRTTRVHLGQGAIAEALAAERPGRALLVVDARQPELPHVVGRLVRATRTELVRLDPADCVLETSVRLSGQLADTDWVVAAGGGSVMDAVALARLLTAAPGTAARIRLGGGRPGLVRGPALSELGPCPRLIAVPTTVGTAAEVSAAATVLVGGHRKLVMHPLLAADVAALDPAATRTLPAPALREGALEAVLRLCNGYLSRPGHRLPPTADTEARDLLRDLLGTTVSGGTALEVAVLSARTVLGFTTVGRDSFAGKVWYLANELSSVAGVRKMPATVALVPVVWSRVLQGDTRFGDADRLRAAWAAVRAGHPRLPADPVHGIRQLAHSWGVGSALPAVDPEALAVRAVRAWGAGLPMLDGFSTHELTGLYAEALQGAHQ
ncbi:iron-containing alcohol dehydrogenase [Streptomyces lasiicapitis]|uniref:iron-containing alcohol dehydrogenase n=1 Tax=Streptomyces lasiicapitis TaxID=1923961 RepID=UPI0036C32270